jgi:hypothetical protein
MLFLTQNCAETAVPILRVSSRQQILHTSKRLLVKGRQYPCLYAFSPDPTVEDNGVLDWATQSVVGKRAANGQPASKFVIVQLWRQSRRAAWETVFELSK